MCGRTGAKTTTTSPRRRTSRDTGEFACDDIERWWEQTGRAHSPRASSILLLCDGGGSNSASLFLFKEDLHRGVDRLGIEIRVAHDPPHFSKYNPIEHRLFPHLTRACQGVSRAWNWWRS